MSEGGKRSLVPRLRFPEFREAGEWQEKELAKFLTESRIEGSSGDIAQKITVKLWGKGVFAKQESIKGSENTRYYKRRSGQFIYSKLDFLNQAFGIVPKELNGFESTVDLPCFDINDELIPVFLLEYVKREDFYKKNGEIADGGRKAKRIQTDVFLSLLIALPAQKAEQQKIADFLSSLDELITAETQKLDALKTHKKGLMQQLFPREGETVPRLRFPEFQEAGEWSPTTVGQIANFSSGGTPSKENSVFWNGSIPWVSAKDMKHLFLEDTEDHITKTAVDDGAKVVSAGTVLILTRGMTLLKDVPICVLNCRMGFNQDVKALQPKSKFDGRFLAYLLLGYKQRLLGLVDIAGHGTGRLDTEKLKAFDVVHPQPTEQRRIADFLSSFNNLITTQSQKIDALKIHKKGLMQQLFPVLDEVSA
jgi:type I restriction enzyme S subunit